MKNIDEFVVDREGDKISIAFTDLFGVGDKYTVTETNAAEIARAILNALAANDSSQSYPRVALVNELDPETPLLDGLGDVTTP